METVDQSAFENININNEIGLPTNNTNNVGASTGAGGTYTAPPVLTTPTPGNFNLYFTCDDVAEYFDGNNSLGIGTSQYITYTANTFGSSGTYTAKINNKIAGNYFVVFLNKEPRGYNQQTGQQTYYESIRASEYRLKPGSETEYEFYQYKNLGGLTGTMELHFLFQAPKKANPPIISPGDKIDIKASEPIKFDIKLDSSHNNELANAIALSYGIVQNNAIILKGDIPLSNPGTDLLQLSEEIINSSKLILALKVISLPEYYNFQYIQIGNEKFANREVELQASVLKKGSITALLAFDYAPPVPRVSTKEKKYTAQVKSSDSDKIIEIPIITQNTKSVAIKNALNKTTYNVTDNPIKISFVKDLGSSTEQKQISIMPYFDNFVGEPYTVLVQFEKIDDTPTISNVKYPVNIDIPSFSDLNIDYEVSYEAVSATSVKVELLQKDNTKILYLDKLTPKGSFKVNLKSLKQKFANWAGDITFIFTAINAGGSTVLQSNTYTYTTKITYPILKLDEDLIQKSLFDSFVSQIKIPDLDKESKYLTHLANFGDDNQFLISSWEEDNWTLSKKSTDSLGNEYVKPEDTVESLILKLYKPLSANISTNNTLWVTKLLTNPLIETVVINQQDSILCPPLKGPNFNIEVDFVVGKSTGYESLDDLILSGSTSSTELVNRYLSGSIIDTEYLNIEYESASTYAWDNFVHFSSATERVDNFVYKVKLIELYEKNIESASYDPLSQGYSGSISSIQEIDTNTIKKNQIIQSFDGFETFLYTSSSLSWPYNGNQKYASNTNQVINWYENITYLSQEYDTENTNWINNNIPQYVVNNENNQSLLLFFSMIGQHFDNIYFHTKAIENSRGLGYKQTGNISDKLLFDILKSFDWNAKNLAADNHLWNLVFGVDSEGNEVNTNPAKKRNYEVWRRIANNLPYLLKHKGTRQGIYALLACYGIPSSNLSILEFGGPEVSEEQKGKLVIDNITTALKFTNGSNIKLDWINTDKNRKPNTIELFVKPVNYTDYQTVVSGSGWNLQLSGSTNTDYGKVIFNYSGSNAITSSLLPIFNGRFFGIAISSGSTGLKLDTRQAEKERTIFEETIISSGSTNWNNGSLIQLGKDYSGSVDEFRLWSEVLNSSVFFEHVSFPEMVNGNSLSASVDDLYFRLDFEYPKNLSVSSSLINVDTNIYFENGLTRNHYEIGTTASLYSMNTQPLYYAYAYGFQNLTEYPHQFEAIDRTVVMPYPDGGASRFQTQKVRFESQILVSDLSPKSRATKKAFDQSPADSNRVGLFFSPTKELNIDIAKSFGGLNIDNYIGDPSDDYKPNYSKLDNLRNYYFQRFDNRNIYEYINLIKLYEKSMFEDIKKMLPARVKATTGLLIEPHFLERSKVAHKKPTGEDYQLESEIKYSDTTITLAENNQFESIVDANLSENVFGENNQFESLISTTDTQKTIAENYQYTASYVYIDDTKTSAENLQYEVDINAQFEPTLQTEIDVYSMTTLAGQSPYEEIGFGLYGDNGYAIRTYIDADGITKKERVKVDLLKLQKRRDVVAPIIKINGHGDPRGGYYLTSSIYYETKLNIQPFSGSKVINAGTGSIVEVKPLRGYLPTHYRNTSDLTTGLINSYYKGSKNTAATTLDGTPPIEVFASNPNTLKVNKAGRPSNEPILEVE